MPTSLPAPFWAAAPVPNGADPRAHAWQRLCADLQTRGYPDAHPDRRVTDPHGRPWLGAPGQPPFFSLSHSPTAVAWALDETPRIGVDLESLARPLPDWARLARRAFAPADQSCIADAPDPAAELVARWVLLEAVAKARGTGLFADADRVDLATAFPQALTGQGGGPHEAALDPDATARCLGRLSASQPLRLTPTTTLHLGWVRLRASAPPGTPDPHNDILPIVDGEPQPTDVALAWARLLDHGALHVPENTGTTPQ